MKRLSIIVLLGTFAIDAATAQPPPTLQLLPLSVNENIASTNRAAKAIEGNLKKIIGRLDSQFATFRTVQCDSLTRDEGCQQLTDAMASTYDELLGELEKTLPELRQPLLELRDELQTRIRYELGLKRTPRELQKLLLTEGVSSQALIQRRQSNRRSLTDGVRTLASLLPRLATGATGTLSASEFYLDAVEAVRAIELVEGKIPYARAQLSLAKAWGGVDDAVIEGVRGFTDLYFGGENDELRPDRPLELAEREIPDPAISELTNW